MRNTGDKYKIADGDRISDVKFFKKLSTPLLLSFGKPL
jgi:hypothetical protein